MVEAGLPLGLGVADEGFVGGAAVVGRGVVGRVRRDDGLRSDVTFRTSSESSKPSLDADCDLLRWEEVPMTTEIRDGVRVRVAVDGTLASETGRGGPDDGVPWRGGA